MKAVCPLDLCEGYSFVILKGAHQQSLLVMMFLVLLFCIVIVIVIVSCYNQVTWSGK
jgi:hypothetical protein